MAMEASDADAAATAACVQLRRGNKKWLEELSEREDGLCGVAQEMIGEELLFWSLVVFLRNGNSNDFEFC